MLAAWPTRWSSPTPRSLRWAEDIDPRWIGLADLLADDAALLRALHARAVAGGTPPHVALKWLVAMSAGQLAGVVGEALALSASGLQPDSAQVRWRLHPGGWLDAARLGAAGVVVPASHPRRAVPEAVATADPDGPARAAVSALVAVVAPLVAACRPLARVGARALWQEVGDAFGLCLGYRPDLPGDALPAGDPAEAPLRRLTSALTSPEAPWPAVPQLTVIETEEGLGYVGRRAGCCLVYQVPAPPLDPAQVGDPLLRAYLARYPRRAGEPAWCVDCSLRPLADCHDRQGFRIALARRRHREAARAGA